MIDEKMVRDYFRDYSAENMKHLAEFFNKRDIDLAIKFAKQTVDVMPPASRSVTSKSVPDSIMMLGVCAQLLQIKINNLSVNYTSGITEHGVQLSIGEELSALKSLMRDYKRDFRDDLYQYKKAQDFKTATASIASPYAKKNNCRRY